MDPARKKQASVDGFVRYRPAYQPASAKLRPATPTGPVTSPTPDTPIVRRSPQTRRSAVSQDALALSEPVSMDLPEATPKVRKPHRVRRILMRSAIVIVVLVLIAGGWITWNLNKVFHCSVFCGAQVLTHALSTTKLKGEDQGRVNILFAGDSADRKDGGGGGDLTDSIMVVSIDTVNHTGFMLSIPRDTWVNIPGRGHSKINAANESTSFNQSGYPKGGMGQLEQIISEDFGIPINYYALVNYSAFRDAVNAVGGITINIQSSNPKGLYDASALVPGSRLPLIKLPNGPVTLNGDVALNLARARGDAYGSYGFEHSDFDRTQHQRQMLTALEQKALTGGVLTNPIKVSQLFSAIGKNVETDLNLDDTIRLGQLAREVNISNLQSLALSTSGDKPLLANYWAPDGEEALAPKAGVDDYGQIRQYYQQLTSNNPVTKEAPSAVILNGSDISGIAHKESTILQNNGFNVVGVADAMSVYAHTLIIDNTKGQKPASLKELQQLFPGAGVSNPSSTGEAQEAQNYTSDFIVVIGKDVQVPANTQ